jgi:hypothetical protein
MNNLKELEQTLENKAHLSFEEYQTLREPAVNALINDYAVKLVERDPELTLQQAKEIAKREIPSTFVPEWMKNLRISANIAGTELCYLEAVIGSLGRIEEMLSIVFEKRIDEHLTRLAEGFKREEIKDDESRE